MKGIHQHWNQRRRDIAGVLWPSFLVAAVATMVFFALVDPDGLVLAAEQPGDWSVQSVYTAGFFFFWAIALISSLITTWLIRTERRIADYPDEPQQ